MDRGMEEIIVEVTKEHFLLIPKGKSVPAKKKGGGEGLVGTSDSFFWGPNLSS